MKWLVVIKHAKQAHEKEIERNVNANLAEARKQQRRQPKRLRVPDRVLERRVDAAVRKFIGPQRPVGTVHDAGEEGLGCEDQCPDGEPNCRNCGDPAFAESCAAAGHCPFCGTAHGMSPDSAVAANGYELVPA
jgi:hypothetical protein